MSNSFIIIVLKSLKLQIKSSTIWRQSGLRTKLEAEQSLEIL